MYSVVLATMLTAGGAAPNWCHGCHGCCGCYGCCGCFGCCGCCGCYGCCGCCGGCWGCWGCGGCYGPACWYGNCYGCWGTCYGCHGCYGCYGCYGICSGAPIYTPAAVVAPVVQPVIQQPIPTLPPPKDNGKKNASLGNAAAVIVKADTDVKITVDGRAIQRTAAEETFTTPQLERGFTYSYTFQADVVRGGKPMTATRQVRVKAGQTVQADFTALNVQPRAGRDVAHITVKLPADARLFVDNVPCPLTSATRSFDTPTLDAGRTYFYTLKAEVVRDGRTIGDSKRVFVEAGKEVLVEFKELSVQSVRR